MVNKIKDDLFKVKKTIDDSKNDDAIAIGSIRINYFNTVSIDTIKKLKDNIDFFYKGDFVKVGNISIDDFSIITGIAQETINYLYPDSDIKLEVVYSHYKYNNGIMGVKIEFIMYSDDDEKFNCDYVFSYDIWELFNQDKE